MFTLFTKTLINTIVIKELKSLQMFTNFQTFWLKVRSFDKCTPLVWLLQNLTSTIRQHVDDEINNLSPIRK